MAPKTTSGQIPALKNAGIRNMQVTKQCGVHTKTIYHVMKWIKETGKTSSKIIHSVKCFVLMRIDSQMVIIILGKIIEKNVGENAKDLKMAPKPLIKILIEDLQ